MVIIVASDTSKYLAFAQIRPVILFVENYIPWFLMDEI